MPDYETCWVKASATELKIRGSLALPANECLILILVHTSAEKAVTVNHHHRKLALRKMRNNFP